MLRKLQSVSDGIVGECGVCSLWLLHVHMRGMMCRVSKLYLSLVTCCRLGGVK